MRMQFPSGSYSMDAELRFKLTITAVELFLFLLSDDRMMSLLTSTDMEGMVIPLLGALGLRVPRARILGYVDRVVSSYDLQETFSSNKTDVSRCHSSFSEIKYWQSSWSPSHLYREAVAIDTMVSCKPRHNEEYWGQIWCV